ncbi:hypothetical protein PG994_012100 [Apiospora phragmitis]|uniref:Uncharacterized protein n=1 Tax=Apiospora phragmitis TaxID=2905665 RepID=A0ABR1TUQ5_9PEZI
MTNPSSGSSSGTTAPHSQYRLVTAKNSKCDLCNQRNRSTMQKCLTCGLTTCSACHGQGRYDPRHNLASMDLTWSAPTAMPRGAQRRSGLVRQTATGNRQGHDDDERAIAANDTAAPVAAVAAAPAAAAVAPAASATNATATPTKREPVAEKTAVVPGGDEDGEDVDTTTVNATAALPSAPAPTPAVESRRGATVLPLAVTPPPAPVDELYRHMLLEWNHSAIVARVRREEGPLGALDMVEAATTMMAMARGVPFSPRCDDFLRRMRHHYNTR